MQCGERVNEVRCSLRLQGLAAPTLQPDLLGIPKSLIRRRQLLQEHDVLSPRDFCHSLWQFLRARPHTSCCYDLWQFLRGTGAGQVEGTHDEGDNEASAFRRVEVERVMQIGRNEPCPCGSGKKYKRCCLVTDEQATRPPGQDLHDLDHRIFVDLGTWARRRFHAESAGVYDEYPIEFGERKEHLTLFAAWVAYERKIDGRVLADWYLEERGRNLMTHERAWLTAQLASWLSIWEIIEVEPGKSIRLRDQLTGAERTVSEVSGSQTLSPHLLLLARVVEQDGLSLLIGMHPSPLTPQVGRDTLDHVRTELGLAKTTTPEELRAADRPTRLIEIWQDAVEEVENRPLPRLQNTDGEDLVLIEDHYKLVGTGARAAVEAELSNLRDVHRPEPSERKGLYRVVRENAPGAAMQDTLVATIAVKAREMVVETNSRQRADVLRGRMESLCGDRVRFQHRKEKDPFEAMAKQGGKPERTAPKPEGPAVDALLRDFKARHYATWPDDSLPALDGLTPREAAAQPKYRARLDSLLKEMEYHDSQEAPNRRFDFGPIRRTLGLE